MADACDVSNWSLCCETCGVPRPHARVAEAFDATRRDVLERSSEESSAAEAAAVPRGGVRRPRRLSERAGARSTSGSDHRPS